MSKTRKLHTKKGTNQKSESRIDMHHIDWPPKTISCKVEVFMDGLIYNRPINEHI